MLADTPLLQFTKYSGLLLVMLKVTFDKNVYEFVADPTKANTIHHADRYAFECIHKAIIEGKIEPFISETILTYESVVKERRLQVLSHPNPLQTNIEGSKIILGSNPERHPGLHPKDEYYFKKAVALGFKILPGRRFGKLIIPAIQEVGFYTTEEDYFEAGKRFEEITHFIEEQGCGYRVYYDLTCPPELKHLNPVVRFQFYKGTEKQLSQAVAEWSDGDSVALHITNKLDVFCSNDSGRNAKTKSVFQPEVIALLMKRYGFTKLSPQALCERIV